MPKHYIEIAVALVVAFASVLGLFEVVDYPDESGYVPFAVLIFSLGLAIIWIFRSVRAGHHVPERLHVKQVVVFRFVGFLSIIIAYSLGFYLVGFYTSTFLMIPAASYFLGYRRWRVALATALVYLIILNVVFSVLLKTPLPPELILRLNGML